jgi:glycerophosphoryl diester phosphodiesterase
VVAHRGEHNGIPENSLPAYRKEIEPGYDFVEIGVRTTMDGRFVSVRNSGIDDYVEGYRGKVREYSFSELRSMDIGLITGREWKTDGIQTDNPEGLIRYLRTKL